MRLPQLGEQRGALLGDTLGLVRIPQESSYGTLVQEIIMVRAGLYNLSYWGSCRSLWRSRPSWFVFARA